MKKLLSLLITLLLLLGVGVVGVKAFFSYQDTKLQEPVEKVLKNASNQQLRRLSGNQKTYKFLTRGQIQHVWVDSGDNQGWKQYGDYGGKLNGHQTSFRITTIKESFWRPKYQLTRIYLD